MDSGGGAGSGGHKAASGSAPSPAPNPTAMLSALMSKRAKLQEELRSIERQVKASPVSLLLSDLLIH
jgi:chromatin modification-related protein EAF6